MKKYFIHCETDIVGTDSYDIIEAENEEEADTTAKEMAYDNFQSYDFSSFEEDCESDGVEFIEGEYYNWYIEEYNPKKHNEHLFKTDDLYEEEDDASSEESE